MASDARPNFERLLSLARHGQNHALGQLLEAYRNYLGTQRRDVRLEQQLGDDLDQSSQRISQRIQAVILAQSTPSQRTIRHCARRN